MSAGVKFDLIGAIAAQQSNQALAMYNAGIKNLQIPGLYLGFEVQDLPSAVKAFQTLNFKGFTVSMPYKQDIITLIGGLSEDARAIEAVNTVVNDHGVLFGHNTDWIGAISALKAKTDLYGKKVVLIGAGGAARAIAFGLHKEQCKVTVLNRTESRAQQVASPYDFDYGPLSRLDHIEDYDILVNATSVGDAGSKEKNVVPFRVLSPDRIVMDVVADPSQTVLISKAESWGYQTITGLEMLIYQAIEQFKIFFGKAPPYQTLKEGYMTCLTA